ncbi:hypothetical protein [Primorskyibacter sp. S87]|uniref:hypothetical protein n=1 Tax=Primorskyibacter sp. S87 TaxID=3415126 RepID=UPI003C79C439
MSFVRPEASAALWRWREVLTGAAITLLGISWIIGPGGLLGLVGWPVLLGGVALAVIGVQRARFRKGGGGPGVVLIDEGEVTYLGPLTGGVIAIDNMQRLTLDPTGSPAHWVLEQPGHPPLMVPVNAEGADGLFDAFAILPGLRTERMLAELNGGAVHPVVIWERQSTRPSLARLH